MNTIKKITVLSLLFCGTSLFSAEAMSIQARAKRAHTEVEKEEVSSEPAAKKARVTKIKWADENKEFSIPKEWQQDGITVTVQGTLIYLPVKYEAAYFAGTLDQLPREEKRRLIKECAVPQLDDTDEETETDEELVEVPQPQNGARFESAHSDGMVLVLRRKDS